MPRKKKLAVPIGKPPPTVVTEKPTERQVDEYLALEYDALSPEKQTGYQHDKAGYMNDHTKRERAQMAIEQQS